MKGLFKSKPRTPVDIVRQTRDLLIYVDRNSTRDGKREDKVPIFFLTGLKLVPIRFKRSIYVFVSFIILMSPFRILFFLSNYGLDEFCLVVRWIYLLLLNGLNL